MLPLPAYTTYMVAPIKDPQQQTGNAKHLLVLVAILLFVFGVVAIAASKPITTQQSPAQVAGIQTQDEFVAPEDTAPLDTPATDTNVDYYTVSSVSDGDTIKVLIGSKTETVRLIGVDTPETKDPRKPVQCFGKQASDFTNQQLKGVKVRLAADTTQQDRDKYGRLLRYVYMQNGTLFNQLLVASGYAYEYTYQNNPYQFRDDFIKAQRLAQIEGRGLWSEQSCGGKR